MTTSARLRQACKKHRRGQVLRLGPVRGQPEQVAVDGTRVAVEELAEGVVVPVRGPGPQCGITGPTIHGSHLHANYVSGYTIQVPANPLTTP